MPLTSVRMKAEKITRKDKSMSKKTKIFLSLFLVFTAISLYGCSKANPNIDDSKTTAEEADKPGNSKEPDANETNASTTYPLTLTDSLGNEITIEKEPERVLSLSPANTEILFALGAGDRVKGRTDYCTYPEEAQQVESVGTYTSPNTELIIAMEPEVLFASDYMEESIREQVEAAGAQVIVVSANSVQSVQDVILQMGQVLNLNENAEKLVTSMKEDLKELKDSIASEGKQKTIFVDLGDYYSAGPGSLLDDMLNQIGVVNIVGDQGKTWPQLSLEAIIEKNPDIYLSLYTSPEELKSRSGLNEIDCIKNDRIIYFDGLSPEADLIQRPGPRLVEGIQILADHIYDVE